MAKRGKEVRKWKRAESRERERVAPVSLLVYYELREGGKSGWSVRERGAGGIEVFPVMAMACREGEEKVGRARG